MWLLFYWEAGTSECQDSDFNFNFFNLKLKFQVPPAKPDFFRESSAAEQLLLLKLGMIIR